MEESAQLANLGRRGLSMMFLENLQEDDISGAVPAEAGDVAKYGENGSKRNVLEDIQGDDMCGAMTTDTGCSTCQGMLELSKGPRGSKRKELQSSSDNIAS
ncbi:hypothetical protein ACH5RR_017791 [Cinchona calisaya]|uniref:Uncharacterized protein n=1 Tax=Cinchona calisaya TaxID=153742 RepID=A0ABD2ZJL4_9GENT